MNNILLDIKYRSYHINYTSVVSYCLSVVLDETGHGLIVNVLLFTLILL